MKKIFWVSVTEGDLVAPCAEFDMKLSELVKCLSALVPGVLFRFNYSSERYQIEFLDIPPEKIQSVHEAFARLSLSITTDGPHFSGPF